MENMVVDTTVWVHFFRKDERAKEFLLGLEEDILVSRITVMEIIFGRKSKTDIENMWRQFEKLDVGVVEINENISAKAGEIFERYFPTRGIGLLDTFVAATAMDGGLTLATHNVKPFNFIKSLNLTVPY